MGGNHEQWAFDVAAGPGGTLVAGGENVWGEIRPRLWFSADGEAWASVDGGPGGPLDTTGEESVRAVAPVGDGLRRRRVAARRQRAGRHGLVLGRRRDVGGARRPRRWRGPGRQELSTVTAFDGGLVAGGMSDLDGNGQGDARRVALDRRPHVVARSSAALPMSDAASATPPATSRCGRSRSGPTGGLIAAGGNDWRPRLWQSTDGGVTWAELADPVHGDLFQDGVSLRAAASLDGVTVAIGAEPTVLRLAGPAGRTSPATPSPRGGAQPFATSVVTGARAKRRARRSRPAACSPRRRREPRDASPASCGAAPATGGTRSTARTCRPATSLDVATFAGGFVAVGFEDFGLADQARRT